MLKISVFIISVSEPQKSGKLFRLENLQLHCKQDSIPVGCVPTAKVASTPGWGSTPIPYPQIPYSWIPYPLERTWDQRYPTLWKEPDTRDTLPPEKDLGPEIPYPQKGPGTRDTQYPVHRQTPVKTLPSRNFVCGRLT